jgi:hypothetical protein
MLAFVGDVCSSFANERHANSWGGSRIASLTSKAALQAINIVPPPPGQESAALEEIFALIKAALRSCEAAKCRELLRIPPSRN